MVPFSTTIVVPQNMAGLMKLCASKRRWRPLIVSLFASAIALVFVFRLVEIDQFFDHLIHAKVATLILMTTVYGTVVVLRTWRWYALLGGGLSLKQSAIVVNISYLINTIWPFRLGEMVRIELTRRSSDHSFSDSAASLIIERLIDLCFAILFTAIGLILLPQHPEHLFDYVPIKSLIIAIVFIGTVGVVTTRHRLMVGSLTGQIPKMRHWHPILNAVWRHGERLFESLQRIRDSKRLTQTVILSICLWSLYLLYYQIGLNTFGVSDSPVGMGLLVVGFAALGIATPSLPGAIGIFHAAVVLALSLHGQNATLATSYAWLVWIPQTLVIIVSGLLSLWFSQSLWRDRVTLSEIVTFSEPSEATTINAN